MINNYKDTMPTVILDNGNKIRFSSEEWLKALCSLGSNHEQSIINIMRKYRTVEFTCQGNIPFLIKSLVDTIP